MTRPLLLAGTRVTGPSPHLGTFYGWLRPLARAAEDLDICVLVADLQSLDVQRHDSLDTDTDRLVDSLRRYLPPEVPVVRESEIPSLPMLGFLASTLFAGHHLRRVGPLRKLAATGVPITLPSLLYPAMMVANVLAFAATHILAKPEGRFQHRDVLNDALRRGATQYGWPTATISAHPKPRIDIPSGDGSGPMKRNRPGVLSLDSLDTTALQTWVNQLPVPEATEPSRTHACRAVLPIWHAASQDRPHRRGRVKQACASGALACTTCRTMLARTLASDLLAGRPAAPTSPAEQATLDAESRARQLIDQAIRSSPTPIQPGRAVAPRPGRGIAGLAGGSPATKR